MKTTRDKGTVMLVGAGPGDPDFLTIAGARVLSQADVVIYDALLSPAFQDIFPPTATRHFVGKRCGDHALPQTEIHALMIREARAGKSVVRLQGGDPTLFGRLGEEVCALQAAGVPFTVIPGVTSLTACAGRAGFPLTLRGVSRQVLVVDGHTIQGAGFDFRPLAKFEGTLVVMMGAGVVSVLVDGLITAGMEENMPIALVESATFDDERVLRSTLMQASKDGLCRVGRGPGIVYVGKVVDTNLPPAVNPNP